jgi:dTDP-4-dehydrorhamnose 3,5-epimerase
VRFRELSIPGAFVVEGDPRRDNRGSFARTFCAKEFAERGLDVRVAQCNVSRTPNKGTIRGLHFQKAPHEENKLVRCVKGKVWDVIVDLREDSPGFGKWEAIVLHEDADRAMYIPAGVAHGFQTMSEEVLMSYQMSTAYAPESATGVRWDDPYFGISWPLPNPTISARDRDFPLFVSSRDSGLSLPPAVVPCSIRPISFAGASLPPQSFRKAS